MYHAIISYSRQDSPFVHQLAKDLKKRDKEVWIDFEGIFVGEEWWERITIAIDSSDNFLFVISPDSIVSKYCLRELAHALKQNKNVLPIFYRDPKRKIPAELSRLQRVDYRIDRSIEEIVAEIAEFLDENPRWKRYHSQMLQRAREWKQYSRQSALLSGKDLLEALDWLKDKGKKTRIRPSTLEREFILASDNRANQIGELQADLVASQILRMPDLDAETGLALALAAIRDYSITPKTIQALTLNLPHVKTIRRFRKHNPDVSDPAVHSIDVSNDEQLIASAGGDGTIRIWNPANLKEKLTYSKHDLNRMNQPLGVMKVRWSPDNTLLASGGKDGAVRIWQAENGKDVLVLRQHGHWVNTLAWSPDGNYIASGGRDGRLILWDVIKGRSLKTFKFDLLSNIRDISWYKNSNRLVAVSDNGHIRLIDADRRRILLTVRLSREDAIISVDMHPQNDRILTFANYPDKRCAVIHILDPKDLSIVNSFKLDNDLAIVVKWSATGRYLGLAGSSRKIYIRPVDSGGAKQTLVGHSAEICDLAWMDNDRLLLSSAEDSQVRIWTLEDEQKFRILYRHAKQVGDLSISPDQKTLVSGGHDGYLVAMSARTGQVQASVRAYPRNHVHKVAFSADGRRLLTGCDCRIARLWNTDNLKKIADIRGFDSCIEGIAWSPDKRKFAVGDQTIQVFTISKAKNINPLKILEGHKDALSNMVWSPNGKFLASIGSDLYLIIWDMEKMKIAWHQEAHIDRPFGLDWAPDSSHVVTCGMDTDAKIWKVQSGEMITKFKDHQDLIWLCKWSPDGKWIASAAGEELKIWEPFSGQAWMSINSQNGQFAALEWSNSGKVIWTGHNDGTVARRDLILESSRLVEIARNRIVRELTVDERSDFGLPQTLVSVTDRQII